MRMRGALGGMGKRGAMPTTPRGTHREYGALFEMDTGKQYKEQVTLDYERIRLFKSIWCLYIGLAIPALLVLLSFPGTGKPMDGVAEV